MVCSKCGIDKPEDDFAIRTDYADGRRRRQCRPCTNVRHRKVQARFHARHPGYRMARYDENEKAKNREYNRTHPHVIRKAVKKYQDRIRKTPKGNVLNRVRPYIWQCLKRKNIRRSRRLFSALPYTLDDLIAHLEARFKPGMGWHNMGEWHIDHVRPVSSFEFESLDDPEFQACWALSNLQPLWARENLVKRDRWDESAIA